MSQAPTRTWSGPNRTGQTQVNFLPRVGRRILSVSRTEDITPRYRRIYLSGDDLAEGFPYLRFAPTDHVKVFFPQPDSGELVMPVFGAKGWELPEGAPKPIFRDYTVRGYLPDSRELVLEFALHGHGVGALWAGRAKPGDRVGVAGPRGNIVFPENYAWYLLAGDEAALPALSRFVEELPDTATAHLLVEVEDQTEVQPQLAREGRSLTWVLRKEKGIGGLAAAVRAVPLPDHDDWFVFAGGEVGAVKPIRDYFRKELALPKERVDVDGYWKRGEANLDHHAIDLEAD